MGGGTNYDDTEVKQQYNKVGLSIILSENAVVQVGHSWYKWSYKLLFRPSIAIDQDLFLG